MNIWCEKTAATYKPYSPHCEMEQKKVTEREKTAFQVSMSIFINTLQNEDVLNQHLYQEGLLTLEQFEEMHLPIYTRTKKIRELVYILMRALARPGVFQQLLTILRETDNSKLASIISDNYESPNPQLWVDFTPLQKKALRSSCVALIRETQNVELLIQRLYEDGCLRKEQFESIQIPINTRTDKLREILCHVIRATTGQPGIFQTFLTILRETGNNEIASTILKNYDNE